MDEAFATQMKDGYALQEPAVTPGSPFHDDETLKDASIRQALSMVSRHGLIAGRRARERRRPCSSWQANSRMPAFPSSLPT